MLLIHKIIFVVVFYLAVIECKCPDIEPDKNFNIEKFAVGTWYDAAVQHNNMSFGEILSSLTYTRDGEKATFETSEIPKDDLYYATGYLEETSLGKLNYSFIVSLDVSKEHVNFIMTVLEYDDDLTAMYCCKDEGEHQEIVWVMTRQNPSGAAKARVQYYLDHFLSPITKKPIIWFTKY